MKKIKSYLFNSKLYILILFILLILSTSIGYAYYQESLSLSGKVTLSNIDGIEIIALDDISSHNVSTTKMEYSYLINENKSITKSNITAFFTGENSYVIYKYKLINRTNDDYIYEGLTNVVNFNNGKTTIELNQPRLLYLEHGDVIKSGETKEVQLIYYYEGDLKESNYSFDADISFKFTLEDIAKEEVKTTLNDDYYEMSTNNIAEFEFNILNLKETSIKYKLVLSNDKTVFIDDSEEEITIEDILNSGMEDNYPIRIKVKDIEKGFDNIKTNLYLEMEDGKRTLISEITLYEEERPTVKKAEVTWTIEPAANGNWQDHYSVTFSLNNLCNYTFEEWTISIKFKDTMNILEIQNWQQVWEWNEDEKKLNISSKKRYQEGNSSIEIKNDWTSDEFIFYMTNEEFEVESIDIYKDGIIYDMGG